MHQNGIEDVVVDGWSNEKSEEYIRENKIACPECGKTDFTGIRQFNLMFKNFQELQKTEVRDILET